MVYRLPALNAQLDSALKLNDYRGDVDEYRGITRNLLHLGDVIDVQPNVITVRLVRPDEPRLVHCTLNRLDSVRARHRTAPPVLISTSLVGRCDFYREFGGVKAV